MFKPRLLRETAEIALTEIKRYIENHLTDDFSLRRVSAPLYLPVDSGLNDPGEAVRFRLPGSNEEVEIVRGLDCWLRSQLVRYDIAPGFGVFTVLNALRPEVRETATESPHLTAWGWQQVVDAPHADIDNLVDISKKLYKLLQSTEAMIIEKLPHLEPALPQRLHIAENSHIIEKYPDLSPVRREYQYLHDNPHRAILLLTPSDQGNGADVTQRQTSGSNVNPGVLVTARILVWNPNVNRPLTLAETSLTISRPVLSIGGNIFRGHLAMQILHQPQLLR